jgi:NADPH-dependent glutamate synthase beta subunit-like oxidoreductase
MPPVISKELNNTMVYYDEFPWYQTRTSPCEANCPAGNAIQRTISLIQDNRFEDALENIKGTNPFPGVTGRVCFYPCETACNRGQYDQRVAFRSLERAISDHAGREKVKGPVKLPNTGKKIAIIGSGPAGLTCAYYSSLLGHDVTIIEASSEIGGMLRVIPKNRLPHEVVDREIGDILEQGIKVKTGVRVGGEIQLEDIIKEYDACLIATGAWGGKNLDIPGGDLALSGLSFLNQASSGQTPPIGEKVVVIGSGGTAFDCATTALRIGAKEVHIASLEGRDDMLATPEEIERGLEEGVILHNSKTFTNIRSDQDRATGIECLDIRSFQFDEEGGLQVDAVEGSEQVISADNIICAVGQIPNPDFAKGMAGFRISPKNTLYTEREGVYVAGDLTTGPRSIVEAIGGGRQAAISIHQYLTNKDSDEKIGSISFDEDGKISIETYRYRGDNSIPQRVVTYENLENVDYFEKKPQVEMTCTPVSKSLGDFEEINQGYTEAEAIQEAERCFHCGHCFKCSICVDHCPEDVLKLTEEGAHTNYPDECFICGVCVMDCPCSAITMRIPAPMRLVAWRGDG